MVYRSSSRDKKYEILHTSWSPLTTLQISADNVDTLSRLLDRIQNLYKILDETLKRIEELGRDEESLADLKANLKTLDELVHIRVTVLPLIDIDAEILRSLESHMTTQLAVGSCDSCLQRRIRASCPNCQTGYMTQLNILWYAW